MAPTLDAVLIEGWADAATTALERHRAHIDRINVFPVADRDTGTNLLLTMRAAAAAVRADALVGGTSGVHRRGAVATAEALARGALRGARGNSGVILSQVLRGVAEAVAAAARAGGECGGGVLADALARASRLATGAVSRPRQGTVLTVLAAAAAAARTTRSDRLDEVAVAAARAAAAAVRDTPGQLPELARAGVVDAGGLGLCVVLDALAALVADWEPAASAQLVTVPPAQRTARARRPGSVPEPAYEVMYLLDGSDDDRVAALRTALDGLGDAIAVVGDGTPGGGTWTVHVHCTDIGAAVEAGVAAGRPHGIRVVPLVERAPDGDGRYPRARAVLAVTCGPHVAALARELRRGRPGAGLPGPGRPGRATSTRPPSSARWPPPAPGTSRCCPATRRSARSRSGRRPRRGGPGRRSWWCRRRSAVAGSGRARRARPGPAPGRRRRRDDRGGRRYPHRGGAGRRVRGADLGRPLPAR